MPTLLNLEVSPRSDLSISRDLNASRIPYMLNDWIAGVRAPEVERTPETRQTLASFVPGLHFAWLQAGRACSRTRRLDSLLFRGTAISQANLASLRIWLRQCCSRR